MKPIDRQDEYWPRCSFFGVYDGHGGVACADFLRDNLHKYVVGNSNFPWNPKAALIGGFEEAERTFINQVKLLFNIIRLLIKYSLINIMKIMKLNLLKNQVLAH